MCGFAGFLSFRPAPMAAVQRHHTLVAMGDAIAHRGPDDAQYFDDGHLALVYRRLSIVDVDGGRQPFFNERGDQLLVANGEIYNHAELRAALAPAHSFRSRSDCEVLLHGFEHWGTAVLERTQGMFALLHWDIAARTLTLARDRLGIKPLYLCRLPQGLLFGSELKALLAHPECPRSIDWSDVDRLLIAQPPSASYVQGVSQLPGGELMVVDAQGAERRRRYWQLQDHLGSAPHGHDAPRYVRAYADLLEEVTVRHLQRDVGAGIHLSGGVDSSLLAGIVAAHDKAVPCFTVVERNSFLGGDVAAARQLTTRLGLPWLPVRFDHRSVVADMGLDLARLEQAVWMMDSPRIELEWLFKQELHRVARARCPQLKVVLLGQGADEFAGGYSRRGDALRTSWADYLRDEVHDNLVYDDALQARGSRTLWSLAKDRPAAGAPAPYHRHMLLLSRQLQHHNLWHEDRSSSWHSLEARVPFLDHRLVELLASVPATLHETLFWDKRIVRQALQRFVPGHAVRQPKMGFLDGADPGSQDVVRHGLLRRIAPAFRDKYLSRNDGPFDARKVGALFDQALARGPRSAEAAQQLLQCVAVCIFERQLHDGGARPLRDDSRAPLPLMTAADWQQWPAQMAAPPRCAHGWRAADTVQLQPGVEVLMPVRAGGARFCIHRDGLAAGELTLGDSHGWAATLLRNIGSPASAHFTVQDWLDEFDIGLPALAELLDLLHHQGVLAIASPVAEAPAAGPAHRLRACWPATC